MRSAAFAGMRTAGRNAFILPVVCARRFFQTRKKEDETVLLFCLNEVKRMRPAAAAARKGCCLQP